MITSVAQDAKMTGTTQGGVAASPVATSTVAAYSHEAAAVVATLASDETAGLTVTEAAARLSQYGPNQIRSEKQPSVWSVAMQQLRDPMNIMLVAVAVVSL